MKKLLLCSTLMLTLSGCSLTGSIPEICGKNLGMPFCVKGKDDRYLDAKHIAAHAYDKAKKVVKRAKAIKKLYPL